MTYTVKQLSDLAGVSVRTLHYYDEIGLLKPESYGENGYRYYGEEAALRLQQILFFRELDFCLSDIQAIVDRPDFQVLRALEMHKQALQERAHRLERLIHTVDKTIMHLKGATDMSIKEIFDGFTEEKLQTLMQEARERFGEDEPTVQESHRRWNSYTLAQKAQIKAEGQAIFRDLLAHMDQGYDSPDVQQVIARWHQNLRHFYEPSRERLLGLAQMYVEDPRFAEMYRKMHPGLPEFLRQAILHYCNGVME
jgi:DNA-binding transcriptional MerR regulator